jgi:CHAT domain-containing protein
MPLVVLNACEVGRLTPALRGAGGLAQALIERGAGGVVAALWSVADEPAHEVARIFYEEALKGRPFAEILQEIRRRAYEGADLGEDTFAAYAFYGDPGAKRTSGVT